MAAESNPEQEMTFWDHLDELKGTLVRSVGAVFVVAILGLAFKDILFNIILAPTQPDFIVYRILGWKGGMDLINVEVSAQFFVHLRASLIAGLILSFPFIVYQIWRFIAPALYENETVAVRTAMLLSAVLFYIGVLVGYYFVLPVCIQFFMNYTVSDAIANTITLSSYMSLFTSMVLMIGIVFEFPAVVLVLSQLGIVGKDTLRKGRKYAIVVILIISALITPSDPFSMLVLAAPLYLLYEFSILICKDKRPADDEEDPDTELPEAAE